MLIPKGDYDTPGPCWWFGQVQIDGRYRLSKPLINCGGCSMPLGIRAHHVHTDGRVRASILHTLPDGCNWHEFVELADYDGPEFPPGVDWVDEPPRA
jgi:hypothetical protein